jgi:hypothetical protein
VPTRTTHHIDVCQINRQINCEPGFSSRKLPIVLIAHFNLVENPRFSAKGDQGKSKRTVVESELRSRCSMFSKDPANEYAGSLGDMISN